MPFCLHIYTRWNIYAGGIIMQVKHTFLKSYANDKEKQEAARKIYRQLYRNLQCSPKEPARNNKTPEKEVDLWQ